MLKERTFAAEVVTIHYVEGPPSGPPVVLLHGGGDRWQYLLPILPSLVLKWHVYALDLRGHGKSGRALGQYRPEHYAADIIAFLNHQLTEPAILFGHSLGGWVALLAAAQLPELVRALILGDPPLSTERHAVTESSEENIAFFRALRSLLSSGLSVPELASALADLPVWVPGEEAPLRCGDLPGRNAAYLRAWAKALSQVDPEAVWYHAEGRMHEYIQNVDLDEALRRLTCPVLLLQGDPSQGGLNPDGDAEHALALLHDGLHVKLVGTGHNLGMDTWEVAPLLGAMMGFLETL